MPFLAPELIESIWNKKQNTNNPYKSDVFSFGLVILNLITGVKFSSDNRFKYNPDIYDEVVKDLIELALSYTNNDELVQSFLENSLLVDSNFRPDFLMLDDIYKNR